jgi:hypothetical protein
VGIKQACEQGSLRLVFTCAHPDVRPGGALCGQVRKIDIEIALTSWGDARRLDQIRARCSRKRCATLRKCRIRPLLDRAHNARLLSNAIAPPPRPDGPVVITAGPRLCGQVCDIAAPRAAPLVLWRAAGAFLTLLYNLFGAPEDVAAQHTLTGQAHAQLAAWLRCAEAMLRRLLLIEAAAYAKPNTRPLLRAQRQRVRRAVAVFADKPENWRVSFRVFASPPRRRARAPKFGPRTAPVRVSREDRWSYENFKPVTLRDAWPLAERYEALMRAYNDPAPYARRLSRRLHATPHRLAEALRAPPEAAHRIEVFGDLTERARLAWRERRSSA